MRAGRIRRRCRLCHNWCWRGMGIFPNGRSWVFIQQIEKLGARHLAQRGRGQGAGNRIVVNVSVEPVHHVVARVGKELFHRRIAHVGQNTRSHKAGEAVLRCERLHIFERRCVRCWCQCCCTWGSGQGRCWRSCQVHRKLGCIGCARCDNLWLRIGHRLNQGLARAQRLLALRPAAQKALSHGHHRPVQCRQTFSQC